MRRNTAAISRRLEGEHRRFDETADPAAMTNEQIAASVYRLQGRRDAKLAPRIRELVAARHSRWAS